MFNHRLGGLQFPKPKRRYKVMSSETGLAEARRISPSPNSQSKIVSSGHSAVVDESDDVKVKEDKTDHITLEDHDEKQKEPDPPMQSIDTATTTTTTPTATPTSVSDANHNANHINTNTNNNNKSIPSEPGLNGNHSSITVDLSSEEEAIHRSIEKEQKTMNQCFEKMVESLNGLESDAQSKMVKINGIFDALIQQMNDRKNAMIHELQKEVLREKETALQRIDSAKSYQSTLNSLDASYQSLATNESLDDNERKIQILSLRDQFDSKRSTLEFNAEIKLRFEVKEMEKAIYNFGSIRIGQPGDIEYDQEKPLDFVDNSAELLLSEIPVKKLYRWASSNKSGEDFKWQSRVQRSVIYFYQNKNSFKVRMILKERESERLLMNQWVSTKELVEKEALVWLWTAFDAAIAKEEGDDKKGYTKWCAKFFDEIAFERFEDQYDQARKINLQVFENNEKLRKRQEKQLELRRNSSDLRSTETAEGIHDEDVQYYENDERLNYEMDVWKTYLWGKDSVGKGSWKGYADKAILQFFENRKNKKIRIVLREHESKELKLNHWIPTDCALKSRGDQMWEWKVYDDLANKFLEGGSLKMATICATFIDKEDTAKFKTLFEKYQAVNQRAEAM